MVRACLVVIAFLTLCLPAQSRVVESFKSGGWSGDAYVSDGTGLFSSCAAIARYRSGISMSVEVDSNYSWWIGFSSPSWIMTTGEKIGLQYRIDRGSWQSGTAIAMSPQLARMPMPADGYIVRRFRRGNVLYVRDSQNSYQFRLTGTSRLLARLARCVEQNVARHGKGPGLSDGPSAATAEKTPVVQSPEPEAETPPVDPKLQIEATQALFNLMAVTGQTGLKLVNEADRPKDLKGLHAVAGNDARTIVTHIFVENEFASQTEIMAQMIFDAAKGCEGDFSSGFSADAVEGADLFAGRSSCVAGDVERLERYAIVARDDSSALVFGVAETSVGEGGGEASGPATELSDDAFHSAVVKITD